MICVLLSAPDGGPWSRLGGCSQRNHSSSPASAHIDAGLRHKVSIFCFRGECCSKPVRVRRFLREVVQERAANSMDSSNIATIFAPTVFRPDMVDPMRAIMEVRLSQRIIREIIDRRAILYEAVRAFQSRQFTVTENPLLSRAALQLLRPEQNAPPATPPRPAALSQMSKEKELGRLSDEMAQLRLAVPPVERPSVAARMEEITHSLSPTMMGRMVGRSGGRDSVPVSRAAARAIEEAEEKTSSRGINRTQLSESADNVSDLSKDSLTAN